MFNSFFDRSNNCCFVLFILGHVMCMKKKKNYCFWYFLYDRPYLETFYRFFFRKTFISNRVHVEKIIENFVVATIEKQKVLGCFVTLSTRENNRKDKSKNASDCSIGKGLDLVKGLINFYPRRQERDECTYLQRQCPTQISNRDDARSSIISCKSQAIEKRSRALTPFEVQLSKRLRACFRWERDFPKEKLASFLK